MKTGCRIFTLFFLLNSFLGIAHPWKSDYNLIIETNASDIELEFIESLFEVSSVRVYAIFVKEGDGTGESNASKMQAFLDRTHHQGVLCAIQGVVERKYALDSVVATINLYAGDKITYLALSGLDMFTQFIAQKRYDLNILCVSHAKDHALVVDLKNSKNHNLVYLEVDDNESLIEQLGVDMDNRGKSNCQIFEAFPADISHYLAEIGSRREDVINSYGREEWEAVVLTSEIHRHVGVYSILGAKMGIRALEYFGAGVDEMQLLSFAGQKPPISCLNDGLQVSTGATLGHGLIQISNDSIISPEVVFTYLGQVIKIKLKDEYRKEVYQEIHQIRLVYDLQHDMYWELVRNFALKCWFGWNRHDIFKIEQVK